jgi:hypothetical protein
MIQSTNYSYRQTDCFDYCIGREINKRINTTDKIDHWMNLLIQNSTNYSTIDLYLKLIQNNIINSKCVIIECPEECDSISYDIFHSF